MAIRIVESRDFKELNLEELDIKESDIYPYICKIKAKCNECGHEF